MNGRYSALRAVAAAAAGLTALTLTAVPAQAAAKATTATLTAKATTVAKGAAITLSGVLQAGAKKLGARTVTLSFRKDTQAYAVVAKTKTDAAGRFKLQRTAITTGTWKIEYRGGDGYRPAAATRTVTVTAAGYKLRSSFTNIVGRLDPYNQVPGEVGEWASDRRYQQDISRTYKVAWSFSCRAATVGWHLYWIGGSRAEDDVDIAWIDYAGSGSGTFTGRNGWDGDPWTSFDRYLKLEIWGDNSRSCTSTIKVYVTARVPV